MVFVYLLCVDELSSVNLLNNLFGLMKVRIDCLFFGVRW